MPVGPGKYDSLCTKVREESGANAAIVIVLGGIHGDGFSVQALGRDMASKLPDLLDNLSKQIRESLK